MSLMDGLMGALGGALGGQQGGGSNPLLQLAMQMLAGGGQGGAGAGLGGLGGLIQAFERNGLGDVAQSWVGTGQNLPVSPEQLQQVLGGDVIGGLARQLGLSPQQASSGLADVLPQLVDRLTPQGTLPQGQIDVAGIMNALGLGR
ncbi:MAG: hypothetical protein RJA99_5045 [Pseudomonadota bacterium]|jgi:uncharacterized protein YidB (DUF937 family)